MTAVLEARGLGKRFGGLTALEGVNVELGEGEILGVIGPNGAGKTTLFSLIAGALPPSAGEVRLRGRRMTGQPPERVVHAGIARTHQIVRPFRELTVRENVAVGAHHGRHRAGGDVAQRTAELLAFVGLEARADERASALTLAEQKRLELARALGTAPEVLLLDEVIAGVNPSEALALAGLIRSIRDERKVSILLIEHVMPAVMKLSDRVLVLDHGRSIALGVPAEVVRDARVIEAYLGSDAAAESHEASLPPRAEEATDP
jgi:branched-chain amino acid transport system ATP-binding protein